MIDDTPDIDNYPIYHNETIVINDSVDQYLFNLLSISLVSISLIAAFCRGYPTAMSRINDSRQRSQLSNYISHQEVKEEINTSVELCSICIESYLPQQKSITLPCNHKFHSNCIKEWLEQELTCPMCRTLIKL